METASTLSRRSIIKGTTLGLGLDALAVPGRAAHDQRLLGPEGPGLALSLSQARRRAGGRPTGAAGALARAWLVGLGAVELRSHRAYTRNQLWHVMRAFLTMPGRLDGQS
jgi:hypothetical protein